MAWNNPRTWVFNELVSAALLNTHVRDNLLETAVAKVTAAGDIVYATAANALARRAIGTTGQVLTVVAGLPAWATPGLAYGATLGADKAITVPGYDTVLAITDVLAGIYVAFAQLQIYNNNSAHVFMWHQIYNLTGAVSLADTNLEHPGFGSGAGFGRSVAHVVTPPFTLAATSTIRLMSGVGAITSNLSISAVTLSGGGGMVGNNPATFLTLVKVG